MAGGFMFKRACSSVCMHYADRYDNVIERAREAELFHMTGLLISCEAAIQPPT